MDRNVGIQQQATNHEANTKAIRSGHLGHKGAPAINSEGLSKNAIKKTGPILLGLHALMGLAAAVLLTRSFMLLRPEINKWSSSGS
eukprot:3301896-Heterocapsa_arctica.AAC.1